MSSMTTAKAATHKVSPSPDGFVVVSGASGRSYLVVPLTTGGAACSCEYGRKSSTIAVECSHVKAVIAFAETIPAEKKRTPCWLCGGTGVTETGGHCTHGLRRGDRTVCTDACVRRERCFNCGGSGIGRE